MMIILYWPLKASKEKHEKALKILTTKQMLQRLPVSLKQKKAGNISENLLSEIRQVIYSLYRI